MAGVARGVGVIVTKYFNAEKNWAHYEAGSFKIGTLEEYRKSESGLARMSDKGEGVAELGFGSGGGKIHRMELPNGNLIENCTFENVGTAVVVASSFNEHVFCCSIGKYSKKHHDAIRYGEKFPDGTEYLGNEDLDAYAEIRLDKFLQAIRFWAFSAEVFTSQGPLVNSVFAKGVLYEERILRKPLPLVSKPDTTLTEERYLKTIFCKPVQYKTENELRVVVRLRSPFLAPEGASAVYPSSRRLHRSIVTMGTA